MTKPLRLVLVVLGAIFAFDSAAFAAKNVERVVSPGGIEAWLVRDTSVPLLSLEFSFRGGAALDPAGKEGRADFTADLMTEGAGDLDSQAFQKVLEDRSIRLGFDAGLDTVQGSLRTLAVNRDTAVDLLRLALTRPRFDAADVERVRAQKLADLARASTNPNSIARRAWAAAAYPEHPYGRDSRGTPGTVKSLGPDDFRTFVAERLARDNLVIGAVGDITAAELGPLIDRAFGGLPARSLPANVPATSPQGEGRTILVRMSVPQSVVVFGAASVKRDDPDYYVALVANYILGGGGFNSRLTNEVREKRGLAYSMFTGLSPLDHAGQFTGGTGTQNARLAETLQVTREVLQRMRDAGPTAEELADAKRNLTGSFALGLDSTGRIARTLVGMQYEKLGIDYLDKRNGYIEAVTLEQARTIARRLFDDRRLLVVVVGNPSGFVASEERAGPAAGRGG
jgi:zinc protease